MDDQFRPVYEKLYRSYGGPVEILIRLRDESFRAARMISESIEKVQGELKGQNLPPLREDAKYFLLLNFVEMVYVPLREEQDVVGERPNLEDLREGFQEDIKVIAVTAARDAANEGQNTVSSHRVIDALHNSWDKLNSAAGRVWEKRLGS